VELKTNRIWCFVSFILFSEPENNLEKMGKMGSELKIGCDILCKSIRHVQGDVRVLLYRNDLLREEC
jgi:hypothetical protein